PPPYPRDDWSFDDKIPPRENETEYVPSQGKIATDNPTFTTTGKSKGGQDQLKLVGKLPRNKKKVKLGAGTEVDTTPATKGEPLANQNRDRSDSQRTLHAGAMPYIHEMKKAVEVLLRRQKKQRKYARLPVNMTVSGEFPERNL